MAQRAYELRNADPRAAAEMALSLLEGSELPLVRAHALIAAASARFHLAPLDPVTRMLEDALGILAEHPSPLGSARALTGLGLAATRRAEYARAMRHCESALHTFTTLGDELGASDALNAIGVIHLELGELTRAAEILGRVRAIKEATGEEGGLALCLTNEGAVLAELGERPRAIATFHRAIGAARRSEAAVAEVLALSNLGYTHRGGGEYEAAVACLASALDVSRRLGLLQREAIGLRMLGDVHLEFRESARALECYVSAAGAAALAEDRDTDARAGIGAGRALCSLGRSGEGLARLEEALSQARGARQLRIETIAHQALSESYEEMGDAERALLHFKAFHALREVVQREGAELRMRQVRELADLKQLQQETELQVLKAQLQPHFLLNSLHSVGALVRLRPERAMGMLTQLGALLRLAMEQSSTQRVTLARELEFTAAYLEVERISKLERFTYSIESDPAAEGISVPHLLIQPIVENAIRHGLAGMSERGVIEIRARLRAPDRLYLGIRDNGRGLPADWNPQRVGVGLRMTRLRLRQIYGDRHELRVANAPECGTLVEVELPVDDGGAES